MVKIIAPEPFACDWETPVNLEEEWEAASAAASNAFDVFHRLVRRVAPVVASEVYTSVVRELNISVQWGHEEGFVFCIDTPVDGQWPTLFDDAHCFLTLKEILLKEFPDDRKVTAKILRNLANEIELEKK